MQGTIKFAAPSSSNEDPSETTTSSCVLASSHPFSITTQSGNETAVASFDYSVPSGTTGRVRVLEGATVLGTRTLDAANSGNRQTITFSLAAMGAHALTLDYCDQSGSGTLTLSNIYLSRLP
jgi:hypothetical protein